MVKKEVRYSNDLPNIFLWHYILGPVPYGLKCVIVFHLDNGDIMLMGLFLSCTNTPYQQTLAPETSSKSNTRLVVYSGRGEALVDELLQQAEEELGFVIEVQYGSTSDLVTRLLTEREQSPADVIFAQDSGHLGALASQGMLQVLPDQILEKVQPDFRDENGMWLGTSGRLRTLVYNSEQFTPDQLPNSLKDLANPIWKGKLGWAPSNSSFQSHVSALRHLWGEEETKAWLLGVQANLPTVYPKNSPQVKAVDTGTLAIGWVNHYYLHKLNKADTAAKNYSFPTKDAGNILMLSGVGVTTSSTQSKDALRFIEWLTSEVAQQWFAQITYEYPTLANISTHPDVPPLIIENLADLTQQNLSDIGPTRMLLQELALQ